MNKNIFKLLMMTVMLRVWFEYGNDLSYNTRLKEISGIVIGSSVRYTFDNNYLTFLIVRISSKQFISISSDEVLKSKWVDVEAD